MAGIQTIHTAFAVPTKDVDSHHFTQDKYLYLNIFTRGKIRTYGIS